LNSKIRVLWEREKGGIQVIIPVVERIIRGEKQ